MINMVFKFYKLYKTTEVDKYRYLYVIQKIRERMLYYLKVVSDIEGCKHAQRVKYIEIF